MPASGDFLEKPLEKQKHTGQGDDRLLPGVFVFSFSLLRCIRGITFLSENMF